MYNYSIKVLRKLQEVFGMIGCFRLNDFIYWLVSAVVHKNEYEANRRDRTFKQKNT